MNIFVFATSISKEKDAQNILNLLKIYFRIKTASLDLKDNDKVLRIEGENIAPQKISATLNTFGFDCKELS